MRIYAVADIHGNTKKIDKIKTVISHENPDVLVISGDITNYFSPEKIICQLKDIPVPIFAITGNSDFKNVGKLLQNQKNACLLNRSPKTFQDFKFIGLNGTIPLPFLSIIRIMEGRYLAPMKSMITSKTILVVHPPPRGIQDKVIGKFSAGSSNLRALIKTHSPLMVLCGHIHEQAGYQFFKNTLIVNCAMNKKYNGAIIDCGNDIPLRVKMLSSNKIN
ncbi:MAG: phosphoesterase [Desulfobacteraceae bacterium]|nr:phosphoesterase [Desulfobacteraceae bacterium]